MATQTTTIEASHLDTRLPSPTLPITLRTILPSDAARFAAILSDPANASDPHAGGGGPLSAADAASIIARQRASAGAPTVLDAATGRVLRGPARVNMVVELLRPEAQAPLVIGLGGFGAIKDRTRAGRPVRAGDVGAMIDPAHRGRGYATEAIRLAIEWAFTPVAAVEEGGGGGGGGPQLDLVTLTTSADNEAMVRLAEDRLGLRGRGTRRPSEEQGQEGVTELYYELSKEDWQEIVAEKKSGNL